MGTECIPGTPEPKPEGVAVGGSSTVAGADHAPSAGELGCTAGFDWFPN